MICGILVVFLFNRDTYKADVDGDGTDEKGKALN
jgi:hypothetical protein